METRRKVADSAVPNFVLDVPVVAAVLVVSTDAASTASPCDESYPENAFRVCWFRGPDPAVGEFLGSQLEAALPSPLPVSGFAIDHDWGR